MNVWRRRNAAKRWTSAEVDAALAMMNRWYDDHPGERAWFAASATEEAEVRGRYESRGLSVTVVPVYPSRVP